MRFKQVHDMNCFGPDSVWAWMVEQDSEVCFLNCSVEFCTFIHYVEQLLDVPYRSIKEFSGWTQMTPTTVKYFVKPQNGSVANHLAPFFSLLHKYELPIKDWGVLSIYKMQEIVEVATKCLKKNPRFLLAA